MLSTCERETLTWLSSSMLLLSMKFDQGRSEWIFGKDDCFCWRVVDIVNKGLGVVARRTIHRGERIMAESPLAVCSKQDGHLHDEHINAVVKVLAPVARAAFYQLSQAAQVHGTCKTAPGIWRSNAYPKGPPEGRVEQAVYPGICRLNHSCVPNTHNAWSEVLGQQTIHAMHRISEGEEITVSYLTPGLERHRRQQHLRSKFGFECTCALCSLAGASRDASDTRQRRIAAIDGALSAGSEARRALGAQITSLVTEKLRLLREEGMPETWGHVDMVYAFSQSCAEGDLAAADHWMRHAIKAARRGLGSDSKVVLDAERIGCFSDA